MHLVGHFYKICVMMHGSTNVKPPNVLSPNPLSQWAWVEPWQRPATTNVS